MNRCLFFFRCFSRSITLFLSLVCVHLLLFALLWNLSPQECRGAAENFCESFLLALGLNRNSEGQFLTKKAGALTPFSSIFRESKVSVCFARLPTVE